MSRHGIAVAIALAAWLVATPVRGQEFATPAPQAAEGLLERGLPEAGGRWSLTALHIRRPLGLASRSLVAGGGIRRVRLAAGISRTGDANLGWSAAAGAIGVAFESGGAALRGVARRDDDAVAGEASTGVEVGGGAWVEGAGLTAWTAVPQAWLAGAAPPLARGLSAGVDYRGGGTIAGIAREAPRRGYAEAAAWSARVGFDLGPLAVWGECREHPWRGGIGVSGSAGLVRCVAQVDAHPVLEPTARLAVTIGAGGRAP